MRCVALAILSSGWSHDWLQGILKLGDPDLAFQVLPGLCRVKALSLSLCSWSRMSLTRGVLRLVPSEEGFLSQYKV